MESTGKSPIVSVIIPNYNHAPYLRQRIDSVLAQNFNDMEVILLDDCSSDSSREIIESYRHHPKVRHVVFNTENSGSTFAQWKRGLSLATGRYVWIAESDDYASPRFLSSLVPLLEAAPDAAMAFSGSHMVDSNGNDIPGMDWDRWPAGAPASKSYSGEGLIRRKLLPDNSIYNASMVLFRRSMAPSVDSCQLKMRYCGDWLFWAGMAKNGGGIELREKLNYFRQHNAKVSPGASGSGLYFIEGIPVMNRIADTLHLGKASRAMLAGKIWKRLGAFPQLTRSHGEQIMAELDRLSDKASSRRKRLIAFYELNKFLNLFPFRR